MKTKTLLTAGLLIALAGTLYSAAVRGLNVGAGITYYTPLNTCFGVTSPTPGCLPVTHIDIDPGNGIGVADIGSLTVPPGTYVVTALPVLASLDAAPAFVNCAVMVPALGIANRGVPWTTTTIYDPSGDTSSLPPPPYGVVTLPVEGVWTIPFTTAVTVQCQTDRAIDIRSMQITATPVGALVRQQ